MSYEFDSTYIQVINLSWLLTFKAAVSLLDVSESEGASLWKQREQFIAYSMVNFQV